MYYEIRTVDPETGAVTARRIISAESIEEACQIAECHAPEIQSDYNDYKCATNAEGTIHVQELKEIK